MESFDSVNVYVPKDRVTNLHQGYGFVEFRSEDDADYVGFFFRDPYSKGIDPDALKTSLAAACEPLSVIDSSVSLNDGRKVRISYKGVPGACSADAALKAYSQCETVPYNKFADAFKAFSQSDIILSKLGATRENVNDTASATQVIYSCPFGIFFNLFYTTGKLPVLTVLTLGQLVALNELRDAGAVASARAAEIYGPDILAERIQDDSDNITRYLVLARDPIILSTNKPFKTSIVFTLEEGPGVLFKALATFALSDINLTKIESWPQRKHPLREVDNPNNGSAKWQGRTGLMVSAYLVYSGMSPEEALQVYAHKADYQPKRRREWVGLAWLVIVHLNKMVLYITTALMDAKPGTKGHKDLLDWL
ncbi:hypothetical protein LOK49_LG01G01322 [Camellia lanceoleosa]|uniref:Uncharacterized protein n=1 Tax=Camellia lanceoleosa TaxID=1840588 RepID=A0ACC0IXE8_9ERIC|nr:hypothetical protein LOK49_LG01G01322 [Camellia lanceoleosa]